MNATLIFIQQNISIRNIRILNFDNLTKFKYIIIVVYYFD